MFRAFAAAAVLFAFAHASHADERQDAVKFLNETMRCVPPVEKRVQDGIQFVVESRNVPSSDSRRLSFREHFKQAEISAMGGEGYIEDGYIDVSANMMDIGRIDVTGTKATIRCRGNASCLSVAYVWSPDGTPCGDYGACVPGERQENSTAKASFRISTCSSAAAQDIREALEFLSR